MRVAVIINPVAGTGGSCADVADRRAALASEVLAAAGTQANVLVTERPGHACELARAAVAGGAALVCAWGGDGTVNEVGRVLAFGPASLGIVPAGSGNGLARELGIPFSPTEALKRVLQASDRQIDIGQIGERLFFNVAGIGLDAHVAARLAARPGGRRGLLPYVTLTARVLLFYQPSEYTIVTERQTVCRRALTIALANSRQYGYGAMVAPLARLDDGALDLAVIEPASLVGNLLRVRPLFAGRLHHARGVTMMHVQRVEVVAEAPMLFHVDGEPAWGERRLTARVYPGALRVRA